MPSSDRPEDAVIEDDADVDRWFKKYLRDQARKRKNPGQN